MVKKYCQELIRPWKLITFSIALGYYIWGAYYYHLPTWDVPISFIMCGLTYLFSPWVVKEIIYLIGKKPNKWSLKLFAPLVVTYACVSGSYEIYHTFWHLGFHPPTYWLNLYYSTLIFWAAGMFWKFEGTFYALFVIVQADFLKQFKKNPYLISVLFGGLIVSFICAAISTLNIPKG